MTTPANGASEMANDRLDGDAVVAKYLAGSSDDLVDVCMQVYSRACKYGTEAHHKAAMAYASELKRRLAQPANMATSDPAAYCDPSDPINSSAFAWPGTDRTPRHRMSLYTHPIAGEQAGAVVVTTTEDGQCVAVTRQDEEGRVLSVIWQQPQASGRADDILIPRDVLKWWRELVDLNPQDLAPRMDQRLASSPASVPAPSAVTDAMVADLDSRANFGVGNGPSLDAKEWAVIRPLLVAERARATPADNGLRETSADDYERKSDDPVAYIADTKHPAGRVTNE